jgi:hypothetical protein
MKTKTLYYPTSLNPQLEVEVKKDADGDFVIVSAYALVPYFSKWIDAMEFIQNRPTKIEQIREDAACLNWKENREDSWEAKDLRQAFAKAIGIKDL